MGQCLGAYGSISRCLWVKVLMLVGQSLCVYGSRPRIHVSVCQSSGNVRYH